MLTTYSKRETTHSQCALSDEKLTNAHMYNYKSHVM